MATPPLWRCPACGQRFVTRNARHSCRVQTVDAFFDGAAPGLRELFERFLAAARASGPVIVNATQTRIALQARARFAGIERPRRDHLVATFVLTEPVRSPRLARVEYVPPYLYVHRLRLRAPADVDAELEGWLARAYEFGRRHVGDAAWPRQRRPPDWVAVPRAVAEAIARGEDPSRVR